ncbi:hypothetical protein LARI1_G001726, partial [Lachnellula arida]
MGGGFGKWKLGPDEDLIKYTSKYQCHEYCMRFALQRRAARPSTSGFAGLAGIW